MATAVVPTDATKNNAGTAQIGADGIEALLMAARVGVDPIRLSGALGALTVILQDASAKERINVQGHKRIELRVATGSGTFQGTLSIDMHQMLADATPDDTVGTRSGLGAMTTVTITTVSTEAATLMVMDVEGLRYVEIELSMSDTASDEAEIAFVDVFLTPQGA